LAHRDISVRSGICALLGHCGRQSNGTPMACSYRPTNGWVLPVRLAVVVVNILAAAQQLQLEEFALMP
jgi:hypothetical protein